MYFNRISNLLSHTISISKLVFVYLLDTFCKDINSKSNICNFVFQKHIKLNPSKIWIFARLTANNKLVALKICSKCRYLFPFYKIFVNLVKLTIDVSFFKFLYMFYGDKIFIYQRVCIHFYRCITKEFRKTFEIFSCRSLLRDKFYFEHLSDLSGLGSCNLYDRTRLCC